MSTKRSILITGASGVVGSALLPALSAHRIIALRHRSPVVGAEFSVPGDLQKSQFGLVAGDYQRLCHEVDTVVHCAADVSFGRDDQQTQRINVDAVANVTQFCQDAAAELVHVSTAFVARGLSATADSPIQACRPDTYLRSKLEAEEVVRDSRLPHAIVRPSVVLGDPDTGWTPQPQALHQLIQAVLGSEFPFLPIRKGASIDFVPRTIVAETVAAILARETVGGEHWVTAGKNVVPAKRHIEIIRDTAAKLGRKIRPPRLVDLPTCERLLSALPAGVFEAARKRMLANLAMSDLFFHPEPLPCTLGELPGAPTPLSTPELEETLAATVRFVAGRMP